MQSIILTLDSMDKFLMNCYYRQYFERTKAFLPVLMMKAWNLKIALSVLLHCIHLRTVLSETSEIVFTIPG